MPSFDFLARSPSDTQIVANALAPLLRQGDVILLKGELGAGKTLFVQALVRSLGTRDDITSPTFGLAHLYETQAGRFIHVDAYRLDSLGEFRDLGLEDYLAGGIMAVEWGALVEPDFPDALCITLEHVTSDPMARRLTVTSNAARWAPDIPALASDLPDGLS